MNPPDAGVALTVTFDKTPDAFAFQISDVPACVLTRFTRLQARPAPVTVNVWPPDAGPSAATNARSVSGPAVVLNDGVVCVPFPSEEMTRSTVSEGTAGSSDSNITETAWIRLPLVPTIVKGKLPVGPVGLDVIVIVEDPEVVTVAGLKLAVTPDGSPVALNVTVPVNPLVGVTVAM